MRHDGSLPWLCNAPRLDGYPTLAPMPRPLTDRQRWQEELAELSALAARRQAELSELALSDRVGREMLGWMIRRDRLRMETLRTWLAAGDGAGQTR
jgi:hypothetical protein